MFPRRGCSRGAINKAYFGSRILCHICPRLCLNTSFMLELAADSLGVVGYACQMLLRAIVAIMAAINVFY
jgi:hypothetical protein